MSYAQQARNPGGYPYIQGQGQGQVQGQGQGQGQGQRSGGYYDNGARSYDLQGQSATIRNTGSGLNTATNRPMMMGQQQQGSVNPQMGGGHVPTQLRQPVMGNTLANTGMGGGGVTNTASSIHSASGHPVTHSHPYQQQQQQQPQPSSQHQHQHQHVVHQHQHPHQHSHQHPHQHQQHQQHQHQHPHQHQQHQQTHPSTHQHQQLHQHQHGYTQQPHLHSHSHQHFGSMPTSSGDNTMSNVQATSKANIPTATNIQSYGSQGQSDLNSSDVLSSNQQLGENRTSNVSSQGGMDNRDSHTSNLLNQEGPSSTTSGGINESGQVSQGVQTQPSERERERVQNIEAETLTREELLWRGTEYEIKCDETFASYVGFVVDYDPKQQRATVYYENGWRPACQVPLDYIRPVPSEPDYNTWAPVEGERVEVKAKAEETEPYGWWAATVKRVRGNLFLIGFDGWGGGHDQVLDLDMLRPFCNTKIFSPVDLERFRLKLPNEIITLSKQRSTKNKFAKDFNLIRERVGVFHLGLGPQSDDVIVVGTKKQEMAVKLLLDYLWDLEIKSTDEEKKLIEAEETTQKAYDTLKKCYKMEFRFDERFTKHVIGAQRNYVSRAEKMPGVKHVSVTDGYCAIFAESYEAAADARQLLELSMDTIDIPVECRRELIGPEGQNIMKLQNNSQVILISTWSHYCKSANIEYDPSDIPPNKVRMVIFGPKENVAQAKAVIKDEVDMILKKFEIDRREMEADRELRQWSSYSHHDKDNETYYQQDSGGDRRGRGSRDEHSGPHDVSMEQRKRRRGGATDRGSRGRGGQGRGMGRGDNTEDVDAQGGHRTREDSRNESYGDRKNQSRDNYENYETSRQYGYNNKNAERNETRYGNAQSNRKDQQQSQDWDEEQQYEDTNRDYNENADDYGYGDEEQSGNYDGYNDYYDDGNREYRGDTSGRNPRYGRRGGKPQQVYVQKGTSKPQSSENQ